MIADKRNPLSNLRVLVAACLTLIATAAVLILFVSKDLNHSAAPGSTLIIHIFADTDPQYFDNLKFFVRHGVSEESAVDYVIIVQTDSPSLVRPS